MSICHDFFYHGLVLSYDKNQDAKVNVWIPTPWVVLLLFYTFRIAGYGVSSHSDLRWLSYACVVHLSKGYLASVLYRLISHADHSSVCEKFATLGIDEVRLGPRRSRVKQKASNRYSMCSLCCDDLKCGR